MVYHNTYANRILGIIRQPVLAIVMVFSITMVLVTDDQTGATGPSKMAEFLFRMDVTCSSAEDATKIVAQSKSAILEELGQKFQTITIWFKTGNPENPFEGSVAKKTVGFNEVEFIFKYMAVSECQSDKVIFPSENKFYLCSVPMVLKGHSCLVTREGDVLLNYYPKFQAVAKDRTAHGTLIYSEFTAYLSGSPALYFWFWIDNQGNIYTLPR